jgi:lysophospholipase L1-like esterase
MRRTRSWNGGQEPYKSLAAGWPEAVCILMQRTDPTHQQNLRVTGHTRQNGQFASNSENALFVYVLHRFFAFPFVLRLRYV